MLAYSKAAVGRHCGANLIRFELARSPTLAGSGSAGCQFMSANHTTLNVTLSKHTPGHGILSWRSEHRFVCRFCHRLYLLDQACVNCNGAVSPRQRDLLRFLQYRRVLHLRADVPQRLRIRKDWT